RGCPLHQHARGPRHRRPPLPRPTPAQSSALRPKHFFRTARMTNSDANSLKIFAGRNSIELAERACAHIHLPLGQARTSAFPDGELMVKLEEDVRGRDCFVLISTCGPVNDNLMELLVFLDCLSRASASRVTVVTPYFGYARQDRKDEGRT